MGLNFTSVFEAVYPRSATAFLSVPFTDVQFTVTKYPHCKDILPPLITKYHFRWSCLHIHHQINYLAKNMNLVLVFISVLLITHEGKRLLKQINTTNLLLSMFKTVGNEETKIFHFSFLVLSQAACDCSSQQGMYFNPPKNYMYILKISNNIYYIFSIRFVIGKDHKTSTAVNKC